VEVFGRQAFHITQASLVENNNPTINGTSTATAFLGVVKLITVNTNATKYVCMSGVQSTLLRSKDVAMGKKVLQW